MLNASVGPMFSSLDCQVLAAVVWVALFHSLLFFLGRVVADPCGKAWSDFQNPGVHRKHYRKH